MAHLKLQTTLRMTEKHLEYSAELLINSSPGKPALFVYQRIMKPLTRLLTLVRFTWQVSFPKAFRLASFFKAKHDKPREAKERICSFTRKKND